MASKTRFGVQRMKHLSAFVALGIATMTNAQLINGSFEDNGAFSLTGWEWTCEDPTPVEDAPYAGGIWSAHKDMGNVKGCWPDYLYQRIPFANDGEVWELSGWVRSDTVGVEAQPHIGLARMNNGLFTLQNAVGSGGYEWAFVTITDTVHAQPGDTAVVLLNAGVLGGPAYGAAWFDALDFFQLTSESIHEAPLGLHQYMDENMVLHLSAADRTIRDVRLFDATGRAVPVNTRGTGTTSATIETSTLTKGMYIAQVSTDGGERTARFVKQ
jgi:hypothetical protein